MIARFELDEHFLRPVIRVACGGETCAALLDTGADVPVFTLGWRKIEELGGRPLGREFRFGGFGGSCQGMLYRVEIDFGPFRYADLPIVCVYNSNMPFIFILSATMFTGFSYTVDNTARTLTVDTRTKAPELHLRVNDGLGGFRVLMETTGNS